MYGVGVGVFIHTFIHTLYIHYTYTLYTYIHDKYITKDLLYISKYVVIPN